MTHAEIVIRAERWLRNTLRCGVVLTEASGGGIEIPDAIGWRGPTESYLIECKVSRADFLADRKKTFRDSRFGELAIGRFRYFMVPSGLVKPHELPPRWGLLEVREKSVRVTRKAGRWKLENSGYVVGMRNEMGLLLSELRRFQIVANGGSLRPSMSGRRVMAAMGVTVVKETIADRGDDASARNIEWLLLQAKPQRS